MVTTKYTIQMSNILARKLFFLADSFLSLMYLKGMKLASFCYFIIFPSKFASHHITNIHDVSIIMRRICEFCALNNEIWMKRTPFFSLTTKKTVQKEPLLLIFWTRVRLEILAKNTIEPLNRYAKCIEEVL